MRPRSVSVRLLGLRSIVLFITLLRTRDKPSRGRETLASEPDPWTPGVPMLLGMGMDLRDGGYTSSCSLVWQEPAIYVGSLEEATKVSRMSEWRFTCTLAHSRHV